MPFQIKRIYEQPSDSDGKRVLVDRLWPRGVSKERAKLDLWDKDVTPSTELRKWFGHQPERFDEFSKLYVKELESDPKKIEAVKELRQMGKQGMVTLLYAAKSEQINHAIILKHHLEQG